MQHLTKYLPFLFFSILIVLIDVYAWQAVRVMLDGTSALTRKLTTIIYWSIPVIAFAMIGAGQVLNIAYWNPVLRSYGIAIVVLIYICKVVVLPFLAVDDIFRGIRFIGSSFNSATITTGGAQGISRYRFIVYSGILISGFLGANLIYGMIMNAYRYRLHRVGLKIKDLPNDFHKMRIVQISDIHSGSFTRTTPLEDAVQRVNDLKPDIILFTGDLVNNISSEAIPYINIFGKLKAKHGVYSILGNHDYGDYFTWNTLEDKNQNMLELYDIHKKMGWNLLRNENVLIGENEKLAIIGVENWSNKARFPKYGKLDKAVIGTEKAKVKILMSHDPSHWEGEVLGNYKDIHITLSGHTHGFQFGIEIPGFKWSPSQLVYKQWAGLYQQGEQYLYVNRGFGFLGYPGRVGILSEITLIELQQA